MDLLLPIFLTIELLESALSEPNCTTPAKNGCNEVVTFKWKKGLHQTPINFSCFKDYDHCQVTSMKWDFPKKLLDKKFSFEYDEDKAKGVLTLKNPDKRLAGRYAALHNGSTCVVCLQASPLVIIESSRGEQERQYVEGETLELHDWFKVFGWSPTELLVVTWYKDGKELIKGGSKHIFIDNYSYIANRNLTIKGLLKSDQGKYTCKASLKNMGSSEKEISIYVKSSTEVFLPLIGLAGEVVLFLIAMLINKKLTEMKKKRRDKKIQAIIDKYLAELEEEKKRKMEISVRTQPVVIPSTVAEEPTILTGEGQTEGNTEATASSIPAQGGPHNTSSTPGDTRQSKTPTPKGHISEHVIGPSSSDVSHSNASVKG